VPRTGDPPAMPNRNRPPAASRPILPGTGRGTMQSMVVGYARMLETLEVRSTRGCPSTTLRVVPLPRWGRIGAALLADLYQAYDHCLGVVDHGLCRNPGGRDALSAQEPRARGIRFGRLRVVVGPAINLYRQPRSGAVEVQHEDACGVLAPELEPARSLAQLAPQHRFRQCQLAAQFPGAPECACGPVDHSQSSPARGGGPCEAWWWGT